MTNTSCHHCHADKLILIPEFSSIKFVASDCRPWEGAAKIGICESCGLIQKLTDQAWEEEIQLLYATYDMYHQSSTHSEQKVIANGSFQMRSDHLLNWIKSSYSTPDVGRYLDFGCGNGSTLRAASKAFNDWSLYGYEPHKKNLDLYRDIHRLECIKDQFDDNDSYDLISLIHVIEHIPNPTKILKELKGHLTINGLLLIQVPYFPDNIYELSVIDHCSHFTMPIIAKIVSLSGLKPIFMSTTILKKEITLVACQQENYLFSELSYGLENIEVRMQDLISCINQLKETINTTKKIAGKPFGIFGTSIAATWLFSHVSDIVEFFVDEDESRAGQSFLGRPVYLPKDAPKDSHCFLALPLELADMIAEKHKKLNITWINPPLTN